MQAVKSWKSVRLAVAGVAAGALSLVLTTPPARADLSAEFRTEAAPATQAYSSKDYAGALSHAKKALAVAKSKDEKTTALRIIVASATQTQNWGDVESAGEQLLGMDIPAAEKNKTLEQLQYAYLQQRRYDKALPVTKQLIAATGGTPKEFEYLFAEYQAGRDCPNGLAALDKAAKGRALKQEELAWKYDCYYKAKDTTRSLATLEEYNQRFQNKDMFLALLVAYRNANPPLDDLATLNMERLGASRDFLSKDAAIDYAQRALDAGASGEADKFLDKAIEKKWIATDDKIKKLAAEAKRVAGEDKKGLEQADRESKAGKNGDKDFQVGMSYFGFGDYPNAVEALKRALLPDHVARVRRVDQANMTLGIALAKIKKREDAEKAFAAAKADPRMGKVAGLWMAWPPP